MLDFFPDRHPYHQAMLAEKEDRKEAVKEENLNITSLQIDNVQRSRDKKDEKEQKRNTSKKF